MGGIISIKNLTTAFGSKVIHKDISMEIEKGKITAIIGGSGTGKSVLIREILGLLQPTGGEVSVMGKNIWAISPEELSELRTHYGVLFQDGALFSALTVGENIAVPLIEAFPQGIEPMDDIVKLRLSLSGLAPDVADKMPSELSGGMVKRAAIARALALEPEILFLDEPTSGLDPINARSIDDLTKTLTKNLGITVVLITHDLLSLKAIADTLVILFEGKVLVHGTYDEASSFHHPWVKEYFSRNDTKTAA